jgi:hypothetical protein
VLTRSEFGVPAKRAESQPAEACWLERRELEPDAPARIGFASWVPVAAFGNGWFPCVVDLRFRVVAKLRERRAEERVGVRIDRHLETFFVELRLTELDPLDEDFPTG